MTVAISSTVLGKAEVTEVSRPRVPVPWAWVGFAVVLVAYAVLMWHTFAPAISEPDDNGYFAQGTLLAQTGRTWFKPQSDAQYIGMHWLLAPDDKFVSRYPPGIAVLVAIADWVGGWRASVWVNPGLSVAALCGLFFLARRVISPAWAVVATALLACNPTFVHHALSGDSHMGVAAALLWGIYLPVLWSDQGGLWQIAVAGLMLGCIPTVRYADAVMGIGPAIFLLWHARRFPQIWKHYLAAAGGAAVPLLALAIHNQLLFGKFWDTGYALTNEQTGFSWAYFQSHAIEYLRQINGNGIGLLFALGFVGMVLMLLRRDGRRGLAAMCLACAASMLLVYMAYYWAPQMDAEMTLRFLVPTFGLFVLAGVWLVREICLPLTLIQRGMVVAVLIGFQGLWGASEMQRIVQRLDYQKQSLAAVTSGLERVARPGDVVVASGTVAQQLDFVRQWKVADGSLVGEGRGGMLGGMFGGGRGRGVFGGGRDANAPSPMQEAKNEARRNLYPTSEGARDRKWVNDVFTWAGAGQRVLVVGTSEQLEEYRSLSGASVKVLSHVQLPPEPAIAPENGRGFGGFGGGGPGGPGGGPPPGGPGMGGAGMMGGPGGGFGGRRGRMGGMGGPMGGFNGETEVQIAELVVTTGGKVAKAQ